VRGHHGGRGKGRDGHVRWNHRVRGHQNRYERVGGVHDAAAGQHGGGGRGHGGRRQRGRGRPRVKRCRSDLREAECAGERQPRD